MRFLLLLLATGSRGKFYTSIENIIMDFSHGVVQTLIGKGMLDDHTVNTKSVSNNLLKMHLSKRQQKRQKYREDRRNWAWKEHLEKLHIKENFRPNITWPMKHSRNSETYLRHRYMWMYQRAGIRFVVSILSTKTLCWHVAFDILVESVISLFVILFIYP